MQQLSHHTLSSALAFSTFAFTVCTGFIWFNRLLLKARDGRRGVVRPRLQRARQHKSSGRRGPALLQFPRCGRRRTKWEGGNVGGERPGTTACQPWATKEHSQDYSLLSQTTVPQPDWFALTGSGPGS